MVKESFKTYLGITLEKCRSLETKEDYFLDYSKNRLVVDKNKKGQVLLFHKIMDNLIENFTNEEVQIALIDYENKFYKRYEDNDRFCPPIAHSKEEANEMLDFIVKMQKNRLALLKEYKMRTVDEFNQKELNKIPYFFIFVDELDYLMNDEQIDKLLSLIALSRCTGIIIFAGTSILDRTRTLCGKVKANFLNRICFKVDTKEESRLVIDGYGAEQLKQNEFIINSCIDNNVVLVD